MAALPRRSSEEWTDPELQAATAEAAQLREANAGLAADLEECRARETELLQLHERAEREREAELIDLRQYVAGCRTRMLATGPSKPCEVEGKPENYASSSRWRH